MQPPCQLLHPLILRCLVIAKPKVQVVCAQLLQGLTDLGFLEAEVWAQIEEVSDQPFMLSLIGLEDFLRLTVEYESWLGTMFAEHFQQVPSASLEANPQALAPFGF